MSYSTELIERVGKQYGFRIAVGKTTAGYVVKKMGSKRLRKPIPLGKSRREACDRLAVYYDDLVRDTIDVREGS